MHFIFQCENNAELTTMHSPAHKNAPIQKKVLKQVHVVILKLESNSGRETNNTYPTVAGCFHHKEIPPAYSYVLSQLHSPHEPIHQATVQPCKPYDIAELHLSPCILALGTCRWQVPAHWVHLCFTVAV